MTASKKFDSNGNFITKWGSYGTGNGEFVYPNGTAVGSSGKVYVTDIGNNRIRVFAPNTSNPLTNRDNSENTNSNRNIPSSPSPAGITDPV